MLESTVCSLVYINKVFSTLNQLYSNTIVFIFIVTDLVITSGPVDAIACIGDTVNIPCGFVNESGSVRPDWRIIRRNNDGIVISDMSVTGLSIITNPNDGLQWIVDPPGGLNHTNSVLVVGPVDESHNQSSYQCYFTLLTDDNVFANVTSTSIGTLTVYG